MNKIHAPNTGFTGVSASVSFVNGIGETDNPHLISWFRDHGYTVEAPAKEVQAETPKAKAKGGKGKAGDENAGQTEAEAGINQ